MREIATKKKPVFFQAGSNSAQGHVLHYITSFCVVFRLSTLYFWLAGKTETKQVVNRMSKWVEGGGSWKGHESEQAVFIFLAALPLVSHLRSSCARLYKTAMQRKLNYLWNRVCMGGCLLCLFYPLLIILVRILMTCVSWLCYLGCWPKNHESLMD